MNASQTLDNHWLKLEYCMDISAVADLPVAIRMRSDVQALVRRLSLSHNLRSKLFKHCYGNGGCLSREGPAISNSLRNTSKLINRS